jgi:PucR C-terminal helix-turn-helix domain
MEASHTARGAGALALDERVVNSLRERLPRVAEHTIGAVTAEVPGYAGALTGQMRENIEDAVRMSLGTFLRLVEQSKDSDRSTPLQPALEGAYALGQGEARSGRTMDALLSAYRVGARVAWRELSAIAVDSGLAASTLAEFAELVFAYIDELSAASVAGHADQLATTGRVKQRYLERLTRQLLAGEPEQVLLGSAERADWEPPPTLTAVLLPRPHVRAVLSLLDPQTLESSEDLPGIEPSRDVAAMLVPGVDHAGRQHLSRVLRGRHAVLGPARPWTSAVTSYRRAVRALLAGLGGENGGPLDTESHLASLLLVADPEAVADLRHQVLLPLSHLRSTTAQRLTETLRSWVLHQGRRNDIAEDLHVHPQTVRYRMGQLREVYGERLNDPQTVLELTLALATEPTRPSSRR